MTYIWGAKKWLLHLRICGKRLRSLLLFFRNCKETIRESENTKITSVLEQQRLSGHILYFLGNVPFVLYLSSHDAFQNSLC